jgi:hypothetical membrane protein
MKISARAFLMKIGGLCGIIAPIIALTCIVLAILISPWFSMTDNWLSDLAGPQAVDTASAPIFNIGLILAGILGIIFSIALRNSGLFKTQLGKYGSIILTMDMLFLCAIGIYPETTGDPHFIVSVGFFVLLPFALLFIGISLLKSSEKKLGVISLAIFLFTLVSFPLFFIPRPIGSNAILEIIPALAFAIFSLIFGSILYKRAQQPQESEAKGA